MSNGIEGDVPVTREGAIVALKLVVIVLAAAIFWQSALAVNAELQARGVVTVRPVIESATRVLVGIGTGEPFGKRLTDFIVANHRLVSLLVTMAAAMALVIRYVALGRLLDYLYVESPAREKRAYTGFLASILLMLLHAGAIYGVVSLGSGDHALIVPAAMLAMLAVNFVWFVGVMLGARAAERKDLRGIKYLAATTLTAGVVMFCGAWLVESRSAADPTMKGSQLLFLAGAVAFALCFADGYVQSRLYEKDVKRRPAGRAV